MQLIVQIVGLSAADPFIISFFLSVFLSFFNFGDIKSFEWQLEP